MIVNNKDKIIIIHNPKTGGRFLQSVNNNPIFINNLCINGSTLDLDIHATYPEIKNSIKNKDYKIYTVVRNPYNRFCSSFLFAFDRIFKGSINKDIDSVLDNLEEHKSILYFKKSPWFNPQSLYIGPDVNILKYESEEDWKFLSSMLNFNISKVKLSKDYTLTESQKERIKNLYKIDSKIFELYNL